MFIPEYNAFINAEPVPDEDMACGPYCYHDFDLSNWGDSPAVYAAQPKPVGTQPLKLVSDGCNCGTATRRRPQATVAAPLPEPVIVPEPVPPVMPFTPAEPMQEFVTDIPEDALMQPEAQPFDAQDSFTLPQQTMQFEPVPEPDLFPFAPEDVFLPDMVPDLEPVDPNAVTDFDYLFESTYQADDTYDNPMPPITMIPEYDVDSTGYDIIEL